MLKEVHVKLYRITKLDLGPEIDVVELRNGSSTLLLNSATSLLYKFTRCSTYFLFLSDEGPMFQMLDYTIRIGSTPTFLYFDLYLYSAYAAHYV